MTVMLKSIDVWSALKLGAIYSPILYTVYGFVFTLGAGVSLGGYVSGVAQAFLYGGAGAAIAAYVYNVVARRFGPLKFQLETVDESQDHA
jgi:hypothetical protein